MSTWNDRITTAQCYCGSRHFTIWISFDEDGTLATHSLDMNCLECGAKFNIPTALDPAADLR